MLTIHLGNSESMWVTSVTPYKSVVTVYSTTNLKIFLCFVSKDELET